MHVDSNPEQTSKYDMIIGRDLLSAIGVDLMFSKQQIVWDGATIPMRSPADFQEENIETLEREIFQLDEVEEDFIQ